MRIGAAYFPVTLSYASYNSPSCSWSCVSRAQSADERVSLGFVNLKLKNAETVVYGLVGRDPTPLDTVPGTEI